MKDFSFVKNLQSSHLPGVEIRKIPGVEKLNSPDGKLFGVSYFLDGGHGFMKVRFTARSNSFRALYAVDLFDKRLNPVAGLIIREDLTPEQFLDALTEMIKLLQYRGSGMATAAKITAVESLLEAEDSPSVNSEQIRDAITSMKRSQGKGFSWRSLLGLPAFKDASMGGKLKIAATMLGAGLYGIVAVFGAVMTLYGIYMFVTTSIRNWYQKRYASTTLEKKVSDGLFSTQQAHEPAFAIYNNVVNLTKHVITGKARAVIIYGPPGMSKTYIVRRTLHFSGLQPKKDFEIVKGTALGSGEFYSLLYENRNKLLILDDFDQPLNNPETVNLLKAVTDSYSARVVSLPREAKFGSAGDQTVYNAPEKFEFLGRIILITNLNRDKIDRALLSRAPAVEVNFDVKKMISALAAMLKFMHPEIPIAMKKEVYDYVLGLYNKDNKLDLNFRSFQSAVEVRYALPDHWEDLTKVIMNYRGA